MSKQSSSNDPAQQLVRAKRTAWIVGTVAVAIYVAFVLSGVLGR
jgi:hypothetical protein